MNSLGHMRHLATREESARDESAGTETLIKAALALSQAIEALGSLQLLGELKPPDVKQGIDFYGEVRRFEAALIYEALRLTHGSQTQSASLLNLNPTTLNCMIKRYGIGAEFLPHKTALEKPRGRRARKQLLHAPARG